MMSLHQIQEQLQAYLLVNDAQIAECVTQPSNDEIVARLDIYSNAYRLRLFEVFELEYENLQKIMGEEEFAKMAFSYIDLYPSRHFSIDKLTQQLPKFLSEDSFYRKKPYLAEVAELIWFLSRSMEAADAPVLKHEDLAAIPQDRWGDIHFTLHPSVKLLTQQWNALALWQAASANSKALQVKKQAEPTFCVVWRRGIESFFNPLTKAEACMLEALQNNLSFADVCEKLLDFFPEDEVAGFAVNLLVRWLNDGMLSTVNLE
jgi:Putative DNA-binding domain